MTRLWVSGHNLSGYSPMSSPYLTSSWESARDDCAESIERTISSFWDSLSMSVDKIVPLDEAENWGATEMLDWWFGGNDRWVPYNEIEETERTIDGQEYMLDEHDFYVLREISDGESALDSLKDCPEGMSWSHEVGNEVYWFEESDRSSNDIPADLEGGELEELIEKLNEQGF